jgi:predicted nucleic acid-binding protein
MLVIDASAVTELVLGRRSGAVVADVILEQRGDLHAPHLIDVEVLSALGRLVASRAATPSRASDALTDFQDLTIERYPHDVLARRVWELRDNFSAYDAVYVALAEALTENGAPLLTADSRLGRAVRKHADVEVVLAA